MLPPTKHFHKTDLIPQSKLCRLRSIWYFTRITLLRINFTNQKYKGSHLCSASYPMYLLLSVYHLLFRFKLLSSANRNKI